MSYGYQPTKGSSSPLPKFGDWDPNNPASAEGFTEIFKRAGDDRKNSVGLGGNSPMNDYEQPKQAAQTETNSKISLWCCCGRTQTHA